MILINLLPHRELKRLQRQRAFFAGIVASALFGLVVIMGWFSVLSQWGTKQESRNAFMKAEIGKLDAQIKDIATLRSEIEALRARQTAVENLQTDRNLPVFLLEELVRQTPEGVQIESVRQAGDEVSLTGTATANERISEFLRNASTQSPWLQQPQLVEIRAASATGPEARRVAQFSIRLKLKRPGAQDAAASAPRKAS